MKVLTIFGTRPEAIKMAPVIQQLRCHSDQVEPVVCVTAQHRQMLDQVLDLFVIVPDIDLNLMQDAQTPSQVAARVLLQLEPVLQVKRPDWVLVQGDTTTVMAAAIAAHHLRVKVGHVEAGLRTHDRYNPFPEEMNRVIADHLSDLHFAPTERARQNLLREGIPDARIHVTGNTIIDALLWAAALPTSPEVYRLLDQLGTAETRRQEPALSALLSKVEGLPKGDKETKRNSPHLILVTAHRRENFGQPLLDICQALTALVQERPDVQIAYPVHLNPNVHGPVHEQLEGVPRITLLPPVDYLTLVHLLKHSTLVLTDSGGIQEEAPSLGVPVLVLREVTERPEAVEAGAARVVGTDPERILTEVEHLLDDSAAYAAMAQAVNPYGDGHAAERIVAALLQETAERL